MIAICRFDKSLLYVTMDCSLPMSLSLKDYQFFSLMIKEHFKLTEIDMLMQKKLDFMYKYRKICVLNMVIILSNSTMKPMIKMPFRINKLLVNQKEPLIDKILDCLATLIPILLIPIQFKLTAQIMYF